MESRNDCLFDFALLLSHVQQQQSQFEMELADGGMFQEETHFGHPPPPELCIYRLHNDEKEEHILLAVAHTKHCVSAQILLPTRTDSCNDNERGTNQGSRDPVLVCKLRQSGNANDEESHVGQQQKPGESISCLEILSLDDPDLIIHNNEKDDEEDDSLRSSNKNTMKRRGGTFHRIAIVLGTSTSRVLSVEVGINPFTKAILKTSPLILKTNPQESDQVFFEPLPLDKNSQQTKRKKKKNPSNFCPIGGVSSLTTFCIDNRRKNSENKSKSGTRLWIAYGDGTIVNVHQAAFFPSVMCADYVDNKSDHDQQKQDNDILSNLGIYKPLVKSQVQLSQVQSGIVVPLPRYHASCVAPLSPILLNGYDQSTLPGLFVDTGNKEDNENQLPEFYEALFYAADASAFTSAEGFPTFLFFTSEDQFIRTRRELAADPTTPQNITAPTPETSNSTVLNTVLGGTASVVSGVVGSAVGVFFGGFGGGSGTEAAVSAVPAEATLAAAEVGGNVMDVTVDTVSVTEASLTTEGDNEQEKEEKKEDASKQKCDFFPSLRYDPIKLYAGFEMHDAPRQIESCTIDPDGNLAATADGLGRVLLIDLSTKQIIRMWKGFRQSTCCWHQVGAPTDDDPSRKILFLVIHSQQRRVVEVWQVRHGPRVKTMQVGRDAHVISCKEWTGDSGGYLCTCYLLHSNVPGTSFNQVEKISVESDGTITKSSTPATSKNKNDTVVRNNDNNEGVVARSADLTKSKMYKEFALRLQRLQQLLADTNVPSNAKDIETALVDISSLKDLAAALDQLSIASVLELKMDVRGADFQKIALQHCRKTLREAVKQVNDGDPMNNPNVIFLGNKILYHSQVVNAFEILHKFEISHNENDDQKGNPGSPWVAEAVGWLSTYETINSKTTKKSIDEDATLDSKEPIRYFTFANSCENATPATKIPIMMDDTISSQKQKQHTLQIYFSDSSKTRRDILVHIFKPLLGDVFAFNVVNSVFDALGIKDDVEYLLKCFGEWFMTLPANKALEKGLFALYSPMMRWLQEIVMLQFEKSTYDENEIALRPLHDFCEKCEDLVRAFTLGALCREAVASAATQKEQSTYGKITEDVAVRGWDQLLRKLRVCLLVSLRLHCFNVAGTFPITVHNVDQDDFFSVYEWIAHDELAMSQKHEDILSLEEACRVSGLVFDPSTEAGDDPARLRMLQNSCLAAAISEAERVEYLVDMDDDDRLGALLLYLSHYNEPPLLLAHRALLLTSKWSQKPTDIETLTDALVSLQSLSTKPGFESLASSVRLEVWQSQFRPIFRAIMYGFDDVQEISENIIAPLLNNPSWIDDFCRVALDMLGLLLQIEWDEKSNINVFEPPLQVQKNEINVETWPPIRKDFILKRLVERSRRIDRNALDVHRVIVCILLVSDDISDISKCVPFCHECFETYSLFQPMSLSETSMEQKLAFVEDAIIARAQAYNGPTLESLALGEIDMLGGIWSLDMKFVRTLFFLAMYEFGKDRVVDELLTKSSSQIDVQRFVQDGVDVVCRRLNDIIHVNRSRSAKFRDVIGLLDADLCEWIHERANQSLPLVVYADLEVPIGHTHLLALRLLSLSRGANDDSAKRVKIHSLIVLSGTLVKAMEIEENQQG